MIKRVTLSDKDYDTLNLAVQTLRCKCQEWIQAADDIDAFDHYAALMEDVNQLRDRVLLAEEVRL